MILKVNEVTSFLFLFFSVCLFFVVVFLTMKEKSGTACPNSLKLWGLFHCLERSLWP